MSLKSEFRGLFDRSLEVMRAFDWGERNVAPLTQSDIPM